MTKYIVFLTQYSCLHLYQGHMLPLTKQNHHLVPPLHLYLHLNHIQAHQHRYPHFHSQILLLENKSIVDCWLADLLYLEIDKKYINYFRVEAYQGGLEGVIPLSLPS